MKKKEKIMILVLLVILVVVIIYARSRKNGSIEENNSQANLPAENQVVEEFVEVLGDGTKLNKSEALNKDRMLGNLSFTNIQLTYANDQTVLLADVENTGSTTSDMQLVDIVVLDKNEQELGSVRGIIIPLQPGATTQFNAGTQLDFANAYDFKIVEAVEEE